MQVAWWQKDQIISAFIVGGFSMTATLVSMFYNARRAQAANAKRGRQSRRSASARRTPFLLLVGLAAGTVGYFVTGPALGALGALWSAPPGFGRLLGSAGVAARPTVPVLRSAGDLPPETGDPAGAAAPAATDSGAVTASDAAAGTGTLADWLRAHGTAIHYRYADYLPGACEGETLARGSWNDGWYPGAPVHCADGAWLVFDVAPLLDGGKIARNVTYCLTFRDAAGRWARHGADDAPGLDAIAIAPGASGAETHRTIGFRVVRHDREDQVEFGNGYPRAPC